MGKDVSGFTPGDEVFGTSESSFAEYVAAVDREAERARALYGMLVVPGLELTHNHADPDLSAHAVAVGYRRGLIA